MNSDSEFSVLLPADCYEQLVGLCRQYRWSHRDVMYRLIYSAPPAEGRDTPRPPKTKKSECQHRFTAPLDAYHQKRVEQICAWSGWSRRDMLINLLERYLTEQQSKEIHNG